jgi:hypothetical protein
MVSTRSNTSHPSFRRYPLIRSAKPSVFSFLVIITLFCKAFGTSETIPHVRFQNVYFPTLKHLSSQSSWHRAFYIGLLQMWVTACTGHYIQKRREMCRIVAT